MKRRAIPLPAWAQARHQRQLETGGAIVSLRQRGYRWDDLAAAFDLGDAHEARRLAAQYLLASATDRPRGASDPTPATDAPPEVQRTTGKTR